LSPLLELKNVSKRFGAIVIADRINLSVGEGEALGIIGPNGAGKTTLFGMISGAVTPDAGEVLFGGSNVTHMSPDRRCRLGMARSFQVPQPFGGMTVFENLMVAATFGAADRRGGTPHDDPNDRCLAILEQCGLIDKVNREAQDLTLLDRKRLELARALASAPRLILLDEVAGGLTEPESKLLVDLIQALRRRGLSIIWIEHVVHALVAAVDRLVVLHNGQFIADGEPHGVIKSPAVAEIYMGMTADV
jgi:branched-chain amino acid transport system ATP-binding protein